MKRLLLLVLFELSIFGFCQGQDFFVFDGKTVVSVTNKDPKDIQAQVQEWQIWLYKDGQETGVPHKQWGMLEGKSLESVKKQLEAGQKQQRADEKFFGQAQASTFFNPFGPVAVLAKTPEASNEPLNPADKKLVDEAFDLMGKKVVMKAYSVEADYMSSNVKYKMGADASNGGGYSDCSHFVNDVLKQSGLKVPFVTTANIGWPNYVLVPSNEAKPGDIIVRRWFDPKTSKFEGHMGLCTGDLDAQGRPLGVQMGKNGIQTAIWGPNGWFTEGWFDPDTSFQYYRPKP